MHPLTTTITTAQKLRERAGYFYKYTCPDRSIDRSIFASYGTHAMKYFAPLGIFIRQGRRTQDAKLPKSLEVYCICSLLRLLDFLYIVRSKKRATLPPPLRDTSARNLCSTLKK